VPSEKARRAAWLSGSKGGCSICLFILCVILTNCRRGFFAQAAALPPLRTNRNPESAQRPSRQQSGSSQRGVCPGPAGVLFQSRATGRLRQNIFPRVGGHFTASHADRFVGVAMALEAAGGTFAQSRRRKTAAALRLGNGVSAAAAITAQPGRAADAPGRTMCAAGWRPRRSVVANRGTSPAGLSMQRVSSGGISAPFSASLFELDPGVGD